MKKSFLFKSAFFILASVLLAFSILSCKVGMGESIDLTAPVLTIESPRHGALTPQNVTIKGTAVDDRNLVGVEVKYKYKKEGKDVTGSKMAHIEGSKWSCDFVFDGDYEVEFEAYAYDSRRNGSDTSHDRVMVLIDSDPAGIEKMSIARGNYVARIIALEEFTREGDGKNALKNSSLNKDYFQNEELIILSNLNDKYGIGDVFLDLYEIDPDTLTETLVKDNIAPSNDTNKYSPEFTIKEDMINLPLGKVHYIKPHLRVKDEAGNFSDRTDGVFAWEPEYNTPHVSFNTMENGEIRVPQGAPIIVSIFDDDDLKYYDCWLVKRTSDSIDVNSVTSKKKVASGTFEKGMRSTAFDIGTDKNKDRDSDNNLVGLDQYWLVIKAVDESTTDRGRADGTYFKATPVRVTNMDAPSIFVDSPEENSVPELDETEHKYFTLKGNVRDNEAGNKIAIAWLGPDANSPEINAATIFFENYDFTSAGSIDKGKVWLLSSSEVSQTVSEQNYKYEFEKKFNFFVDFPGDTNTAKVFMIAARDPTGNTTTRTFRLNKMPSTIKFEVRYKENSAPIGTETPDDNPLIVKTPGKEWHFRINPAAKYGMGIKAFSVKIDTEKGSKNDDVTDLTTANNVCTFKITSTQAISGKTINFKLSATDELDNKMDSSLTILFDEVGELQSITCNRNAGTTFTKNDNKILLQANFSNKVSFYGLSTKERDPYIQLTGTGLTKKDGVAFVLDDLKAYYNSGNETNTVYFECEVPEGIELSELKIVGNTIKFVTNGATMYGENKTLEDKNTINVSNYSIDTLVPYIKTYTPSKNGFIKKTGGYVDIQLEFNEKVWVESGTIVVKRTANWYIPPVLSEDVFLKIWNAADGSERTTLCGSSSNVFKYKANTTIAEGPYMQYTNGIKIAKGGYNGNGSSRVTKDNTNDYLLPDTDTKYVLAYDYNIGDTTGTVSSLRTVLENYDYHKAEFEATVVKGAAYTTAFDSTNGSSKITLRVSDSDFIDKLVNGVEYTFTVTEGAFRDKAYNYSSKIEDNEYKFWVGPVATPVIRVDRIATNSDSTAPSTAGKARFKIDCETPGATISYGYSAKTVTGDTTGSDNTTIHTYVGDLKKSDYDSYFTISNSTFGVVYTDGTDYTSNGSTYKGQVGDGLGTTAQKIHIRAKASKGTNANFPASEWGLEGAFKTVLHYNYTDGKTLYRIYGCQSPEGNSFTASWPLAQNGDQRQNYQVPYKNNNDYYWVSWQILTDFTLQTYTTNYQNPADPAASYGQYIYAKNKAVY